MVHAAKSRGGGKVCLTPSVFNVVLQKSLPHKSIKLFFVIAILKDKFTDLRGS